MLENYFLLYVNRAADSFSFTSGITLAGFIVNFSYSDNMKVCLLLLYVT